MKVEEAQMELSLPFARRLPTGGSRRGARHRGRRGGVSATHVRRALSTLAGHRIALRATIVALLALPLLGGGWIWLRASSLVAVEHVHITGVQGGAEAIEIRGALDNAARRMTTMDFNSNALRGAVASYPIVAALAVRTGFPHTVSIYVSERPAVAALVSSGQRTAVAADGTVLGPALATSSLPSVSASVDPLPGKRLSESAALAAVTVLGAAPGPFSRFVARVYEGPEGLTVAMHNGLLVYFGNATRPHAKWLSLARVLVSPSSSGALYIDVRLPERPAAGFSTSSDSTMGSSSDTPLQTSTSEPTAAALAASLANAVGAGSTPSSGSSTTESESATKESESASTAAGSSNPSEAAGPSSSVATGAESATAGSSEASTSAATEASAGGGEGG